MSDDEFWAIVTAEVAPTDDGFRTIDGDPVPDECPRCHHRPWTHRTGHNSCHLCGCPASSEKEADRDT